MGEVLSTLVVMGAIGAGVTNFLGITAFNNPVIYILPEDAGVRFVQFYSHPVIGVGCLTYAAFIMLSFTISTYNDGKQALHNHRIHSNNGVYGSEKEDFSETWIGCRKNMWENFFDGVFFPWHMVSNVVPYMVLKMNPRTITDTGFPIGGKEPDYTGYLVGGKEPD